MELAELFVSLLLDSSEYTKAVDEEVNNASSWGSALGTNFLAGASIILTGVLTLVTAIGGIGVASFNMANEVDNATKTIQASLNVTEIRAKELTEVATDIFANNFFDSITEANEALITVQQTVGDLADTELQRITESSKAIADTFDEDFNKIAQSANNLVNQGLVDSFDEAFDLITAGFQNGLNSSEDLLDTINEYSTQFGNAGATGKQFFSLLESGLQDGLLGTDKIADSFKEFTLRIQDGSDSTKQALEGLGLDSNEILQGIEDGSISVATAYDLVTSALGDAEASSETLANGTALLGTQFEDLGLNAFEAVTLASDSFNDLEGRTDGLAVNFTSLSDVFETVKRTFLVATLPIGNLLLRIANIIIPILLEKFNSILPIIETTIETVTSIFNSFFNNLDEGMTVLDAFIEAIWDIAPESVLNRLVTFRDDILPSITDLFNSFISIIQDNLGTFVSWEDVLITVGIAITSIVVPAMFALLSSLIPIIAPIVGIIAVVALLRNTWQSNFLDIQGRTQQFIDFITNVIIPNLAELYNLWVNVWLPQIKAVFNNVWINTILPRLNEFKDFIFIQLIPLLNQLWLNFTTIWLPEIQLAFSNFWIIVEVILSELYRWFNDNIVPIVTFFHDKWVNEWLPAISDKLSEIWFNTIEPILIKIAEFFNVTLPTALDTGAIKWNEVFNTLGTKIQEAFNNFIKPVFDAIRNFWEWLTGANFSFNFTIPDLPDWMIPSSPIPLHTAWEDFNNFLSTANFNPNFNGLEASTVAPIPATNNINQLINNAPTGDKFSMIFPNVTNENIAKASIASVERIRALRADNFINR